MTYVGIDVGGTFTDLCVFDPNSGSVDVTKTLTTTDDLSNGVLAGLHELPIGDPASVRLLHHGTTLVTNALIERKGAKVGLITTAGFRDVLEIMRTDKEKLYDLQWRRPEPFVPRYLRFEVRERVGPFGEVLMSLDEQSVLAAAEALVGEQCEAVAVSLLHSYANEAHERRVGELIAEKYPSLKVYLSCDIDPQYREYERASTTVLTTFVGPVVERYFAKLGARLDAAGFDPQRLGIMQSNGGTMKMDRAHERAAYMFLSGPAAGVVGAAEAAKASGFSRIITLDMGGTSCDVSLARDGQFVLQTEREVEFGIPLRVPALDVVTIGAGGGSIARIDEGGALRVGPESAGATPGPACYGRAGTDPTVTDANVALGFLKDGPIAGGAVTISAPAALAAISTAVAEPLGLSVEDAALGILEIATAKMANAIREVSVARGHDPRDFALVAFGGAGPLHAGYVAQELGVPIIVIPRSPGILSALGCMMSDVRFDFMGSVLAVLDPRTVASMAAVATELRETGEALLEADGFGSERRECVITADMRYVGQVHEVNCELPVDLARATVEAVAQRFEAAHTALYGAPFPGHLIEVVNVRVAAIGKIDKPGWTRVDGKPKRDAGDQSVRRCVFRSGAMDCAIYDRARLGPGDEILGPAIVESLDSTIVILPNSTATVDDYDALVIRNGDKT